MSGLVSIWRCYIGVVNTQYTPCVQKVCTTMDLKRMDEAPTNQLISIILFLVTIDAVTKCTYSFYPSFLAFTFLSIRADIF